MAVAPTLLSHSCRGAAGTPCPVDTLTQHSWCCHKAAAVLQGLAIMGCGFLEDTWPWHPRCHHAPMVSAMEMPCFWDMQYP